MVLDAGPVLDLVYLTGRGIVVKDALKTERLSATVSEVNLAEVLYVLCRRLGAEEARTRINALMESGYVSVYPTSRLVQTAAAYKCERRLSLPDCFAIALGKEVRAPILFSRKETELVKEMAKRPFDVEIAFLEDMV
ncbi:MAG: PIN domain-containing protein [Thaumarchaeota archaeon]|nr:PIN domain-containing protein [Nitrososphaerota archaeon]